MRRAARWKSKCPDLKDKSLPMKLREGDNALRQRRPGIVLRERAIFAAQTFHHPLHLQQSSTAPAGPTRHTTEQNTLQTLRQTARCVPHWSDNPLPCPNASNRCACNTQTQDRKAPPPSSRETASDHERVSVLLIVRLTTTVPYDLLCRVNGWCSR